MNPVTPIIAVALLAATVKTVTDFPAYIAAKQWSAVIKQLLAWAVGVGGAFALAASDLADGIQATDTVSLGTANHWTVAIFGFAVASGGSLVHNYLQAKDNTQSAYVPPIVNQPQLMGSSPELVNPPPEPAAEVAVPSLPFTPSAGLNIPVPD